MAITFALVVVPVQVWLLWLHRCCRFLLAGWTCSAAVLDLMDELKAHIIKEGEVEAKADEDYLQWCLQDNAFSATGCWSGLVPYFTQPMTLAKCLPLPVNKHPYFLFLNQANLLLSIYCTVRSVASLVGWPCALPARYAQAGYHLKAVRPQSPSAMARWSPLLLCPSPKKNKLRTRRQMTRKDFAFHPCVILFWTHVLMTAVATILAVKAPLTLMIVVVCSGLLWPISAMFNLHIWDEVHEPNSAEWWMTFIKWLIVDAAAGLPVLFLRAFTGSKIHDKFFSLTGGALGCCWARERRRCLLFGALSSLICLSIAALGQSSFRCGEAVALTMFMGNAVAVWQPPVLLSGQVGPVCMPAGSLMLPGGPSWELDVS